MSTGILKSADNAKRLLKEKKVTKETLTGKKSDVWNNFSLLNWRETGDYTGYVVCGQCNEPLRHDKKNSGTTHLNTHMKRYCSKTKNDVDATQTNMMAFVKKKIKHT